MLQAEVAALPALTLMVAFERAKLDVGQDEPDVDCPNFIARFGHHIKHLAAGHALEELKERGEAEVVATGTDGHHIWSAVA